MDTLLFEVPRIDWNELPDADKPHAGVVWHQLVNLAHGVSTFAAALQLFDNCEREIASAETAKAAETQALMELDVQERARRWRERPKTPRTTDGPPYIEWMTIAGREGGMTFWHLHCALAAIKRSLDKSPPLRSLVAVKEVDAALRRLRKLAPDFKELRDSIGHRYELMETPEAIKANATKPFEMGGYKDASGKNLWMENFGGPERRTFMTTAYTKLAEGKGKTVSYDLTEKTLGELVDLTRAIYASCRVPQATGPRPS